MPTRQALPACCARAASGHAATPPSTQRNFRRLMFAPCAQDKISYRFKRGRWKGLRMSALGKRRNLHCEQMFSAPPQQRTGSLLRIASDERVNPP